MSEVVRSAARVLDLLEFFAEHDASHSLVDIATRFGLPKSSALGLLRTLCARGYVIRNENGHYAMNAAFRAHGFGWGGDTLAHIVAVATPLMTELAAELGESVLLGALQEQGSLRILNQARSSQPIRYEAKPSQHFPAYCTAMGRAMLSMMPETRRRAVLAKLPLVALTPFTLTKPADINARIKQAALDGYCVVEEECERGGTGMAMAIRDRSGAPVAALNVAFVSTRFAEKRELAIAALGAKVGTIHAALGFQP
ncbi:IclR family transcriptional regulator [Bordetella genomosp. 12]|nr:IclR family transcriptional regulator [Bordetella genomosp. 12]